MPVREIDEGLECVLVAIEKAATDMVPGLDEEPQTLSLIYGMIQAYDRYWRDVQAGVTLLDSEVELSTTMLNPETGRESRTWSLGGKIDKLVEWEGRVLVDHKTTSENIEDPAGSYWRHLRIQKQPQMYELLLLANELKVDRVIWDVIRKPRIRPKKISAATAKEVQETGSYCGVKMGSDDLLWAIDKVESPFMYESRVIELMLNESSAYLARRSIPRLGNELIDYATEVWTIGQEMRKARVDGANYQNESACFIYNRPCEYLGICSGHDYPESDQWVTNDLTHPELDGDLAKDNDLLTNSRMKCFAQCRRKHLYRYDMRLRKSSEETPEALLFGTLWHAAMDAWWATRSQGENNGAREESTAIEVRDSDRAAEAGE